ncbi:MAG: HAMP domain-containing protein [Desulfatitalea sp.]|nr:HAMP domain-containing protein [Desulfatitalea sp.]NNJ99395.1 HAMP domain-containing protein [Desulfatitalea sp.]
MSNCRKFYIINSMLLVNVFSNLVGVSITSLIAPIWAPVPPEILALTRQVNLFFSPCAFTFGIIIMLVYERPIRTYFKVRDRRLTDQQVIRAKRRCLNEPFFLVALNQGLWLLAAIMFPLVAWRHGAAQTAISHIFFLSLFTGLTTSILAFFGFEQALQRLLIPSLFSRGDLFDIPGVIRIRIGTRLFAFLIACNIIPFLAIIGVFQRIRMSNMAPGQMIAQINIALYINSAVFVTTAIWLTLLVKGNLTRPLKSIISVLDDVRRGEFNSMVPVSSNDEIGYVGQVINQMNAGLKERDKIKELFGRYVTAEIRDEILSGRIPLDGETKDVTILFCDLRDFTPLTATLPPKEVVKIINRYFSEMEEVIQQYHGLALQFLGDEIEAAFGAPLARLDHADLAVQAALDMSRRMARVNQGLAARGYDPLRHGIGIHSGEVVAANIGSPDRLSYALVGEAVNLASRLQSLTKQFGTEIIISGETMSRVKARFSFTPLPETHIKGIDQPIPLFTVANPAPVSRMGGAASTSACKLTK